MIQPHELETLKALVTNTPKGMAFCPPLQRGLLERIVKALETQPEPPAVEVDATNEQTEEPSDT